jgi:peroxiredoxin
MAQLRRDHPRFVESGTAIVVVGPEGPDAFATYWRKNELPFIGLPDPQHSVLKLYGQEIKLFKWGRMPAQVLIDRRGIARFVHYGHDMTDIPKNEEVLALIESLNAEQRAPEAPEGVSNNLS